MRSAISLQRRRAWLPCVYVDDDMTAGRRKMASPPLPPPPERTEDAVSCGPVDLAIPCTHLRGDHDDLQHLHAQLPGDVLPGLVLGARVHEVEPQVVPQAVVFDCVLTHGRTEGEETFQKSRSERGSFHKKTRMVLHHSVFCSCISLLGSGDHIYHNHHPVHIPKQPVFLLHFE